jgi:hypothetical protein
MSYCLYLPEICKYSNYSGPGSHREDINVRGLLYQTTFKHFRIIEKPALHPILSDHPAFCDPEVTIASSFSFDQDSQSREAMAPLSKQDPVSNLISESLKLDNLDLDQKVMFSHQSSSYDPTPMSTAAATPNSELSEETAVIVKDEQNISLAATSRPLEIPSGRQPAKPSALLTRTQELRAGENTLKNAIKIKHADQDKAFENTSTSVAASQMRNALNNLADTVEDPAEKKVCVFEPPYSMR